MKLRTDTALFIKRQLQYDTEASKNKTPHHYGREELRELLDFIYESKPSTEEEKLPTSKSFSR